MVLETDYLIIGGGIIGLALAKQLAAFGAGRIIVIEKEADLGAHASGRNSGVLHTGIYYLPESLKAKLCLKGNGLLKQYCDSNNLPIKKTGKVIVAKNPRELENLQLLYQRAQQNGVYAEMLDEQDLAKFEPHAKTWRKALYIPDTAIVNSQAILQTLRQELHKSHVQVLCNHAFERLVAPNQVATNQRHIRFKFLINAAGVHADRIARHCGVGKEYYLIPFKGMYRKLIPTKTHLVNSNIYPVPNLNNPFLGVHFTKQINGEVYLGPTAIPAFGRENYGILQGIDADIVKILFYEIKLFALNSKFRNIALTECKKYLNHYFFKDARQLVVHLERHWLMPCNKIGIRPQLINIQNSELVMDFVLIKSGDILHILNAISPAFTSSLAFAEYIVENYFS